MCTYHHELNTLTLTLNSRNDGMKAGSRRDSTSIKILKNLPMMTTIESEQRRASLFLLTISH